MDRIKKNFGFGCMRLPMIGEEVDIEQTKQMVDAFLDAGFNYFDTAHGYIQGKSEKALKTCLTSRYPREKYILTDKLTANYFKTEADIRPFFESQLEICGVEYFDFYLMHAQGLVNYDHFKECRAYETAFALKKEGKIRHVGISFHDRAEVLERILTEYPEIEVVQIQFNYVDYDDPAVQSRKCYEVCRKFNKPVIVMEPVKGGNLVNLPEDAKAVLEDLHGGSPVSYAIRFVAGFPGMMMVLSGMSSMEQMKDNLSCMKDFQPLNETELEAVKGLTVPIVREDTSMEELENNPRVSREEIFKFIFEGLNTAETLLANYSPATKNLPSLAVIYGLKARAYLWLGGFTESYAEVPTGDAAYRLAAEYARKAIDASGCTIMTESQWLDPKTGFNTVNSSWMWAMIQTTDTVLNNLLSLSLIHISEPTRH